MNIGEQRKKDYEFWNDRRPQMEKEITQITAGLTKVHGPRESGDITLPNFTTIRWESLSLGRKCESRACHLRGGCRLIGEAFVRGCRWRKPLQELTRVPRGFSTLDRIWKGKLDGLLLVRFDAKFEILDRMMIDLRVLLDDPSDEFYKKRPSNIPDSSAVVLPRHMLRNAGAVVWEDNRWDDDHGNIEGPGKAALPTREQAIAKVEGWIARERNKLVAARLLEEARYPIWDPISKTVRENIEHD